MTAPSPGRGRSLARAALVGLALAGLVGGVAFVASAVRLIFRGVDCAHLLPSECTLEREVAATVGRTQLGIGLGLDLLAIAGFLWLRASAPRSDT